jgi:two-component system sensor histidine kinase DesK
MAMRPINLLNRLRITKYGEAGWQPYVWLCYLGFLFLPLAWPDDDHRWLWPTLLSIAVFLPFYFRCFSPRARWKLGNVLTVALIGLALAPFNIMAFSYTVYAVSLAPSALRGFRQPILLTLALLGAYVLEIFLLRQPQAPMTAGIAAMVCLVSCFGTITLAERARQNVALRLSHEEIRRLATVAERERIGRDLHDLLGHTLSLIAIKSELAGKLIDKDREGARREIAEMTQVAREALRQVRSAVTGMRAAALDAELTSARALLESSGISVSMDRAAITLSPGIETALAMIVREATTNIHRHSQARRATIVVEAGEAGQNEQVRLTVTDDGRGGTVESGTGITGIRERVRSLGGNLTIDSPRGRGTVLRASLPLENAIGGSASTVGESPAKALDREVAHP